MKTSIITYDISSINLVKYTIKYFLKDIFISYIFNIKVTLLYTKKKKKTNYCLRYW